LGLFFFFRNFGILFLQCVVAGLQQVVAVLHPLCSMSGMLLAQFQSLQGVNQLDFVPPPLNLSFAMRPATSVLLNLYQSRSRGLSLACRGRHLSYATFPTHFIFHYPLPFSGKDVKVFNRK